MSTRSPAALIVRAYVKPVLDSVDKTPKRTKEMTTQQESCPSSALGPGRPSAIS